MQSNESGSPWPFRWGSRTFLMGVLNLTPDSFSGDGLLESDDDIVVAALQMQRDGADILDIGGESTRPGYTSVPADEELRRVIPSLERIVANVDVPLSIDTTKPVVARRALEAGARVINDVSGSMLPDTLEIAAESGAGVVLTHRGRSEGEGSLMSAILGGLSAQADSAIRAGVEERAVVIDPGLGFGKNWLDNFQVIRELDSLRAFGFPVLVGPSRKGMIGKVLGTPPHDRIEGTIALVTMCIANGADMIRVHDVKALKRAATMIDTVVRGPYYPHA